MKKFKHPLKVGAVSLLALSLSACFHSEDDDDEHMHSMDASYRVTISNITNGQPLTPAAVVIHKSGYSAWSLGSAASSGLEKLAESGETTDFIAEAAANANVVSSDVAGTGPFSPGSSAMVEIMAAHSSDLQLSIASMLANTNDAFTGMKAVDIGEMAAGDSMTMMSHVFDAGTEANTEASGTIAGPVDTSTGDKAYNSARDDLHDFVSIHAGVVTMDDGLTTSILDESHRWNGVAAKIVIERL